MPTTSFDDLQQLQPPYYHSLIKNCGFVTEQGVVEYEVHFTPELEQRYREMIKRAQDSDVGVRSWDLDRLGRHAARSRDSAGALRAISLCIGESL